MLNQQIEKGKIMLTQHLLFCTLIRLFELPVGRYKKLKFPTPNKEGGK